MHTRVIARLPVAKCLLLDAQMIFSSDRCGLALAQLADETGVSIEPPDRSSSRDGDPLLRVWPEERYRANLVPVNQGTEMSEFDGKVAVITGATSGIGRQAAETFVQNGMFVVAAGRREAEGRELEQQCGSKLVFSRTDVCNEADVRRCIDLAISRFGRLDCVVNNAGGPETPAPIAELDLDKFYAAVVRHVGGILSGIKYAVPHLKSRGRGSIINLASINGSRAGLAGVAYSTVKAAVIHLTRCAAIELGPANIRVNSVSPGPVKTGIFGKSAGVDSGVADREMGNVESAFKKILPNLQSIPRMTTPQDVANLLLFLASDRSEMITGQDLVIDGGILAGRPTSVMRADYAHFGEAFAPLRG
jgi:NAD(P)-dependent dehydrogenase (short-subunit alcohol dehydrogenase family)